MMKFTFKHTDLLYAALDIILDDDAVELIIRDEHFVIFKTVLGRKGMILPSKNGDRKIYLDDNVVYVIENDVYSIISHGDSAPTLESYLPRLVLLYNKDLQTKSKILVSVLLEKITKLAFSGLIKIDLEKDFGPFNYIQVLKNTNENSVTI
jgi:hypothetical protein